MSATTTCLFLIRHGETPWTSEHRYQGSSDGSLTSIGRRQARAIGKRIQFEEIDVLYSSSLKRACETSKIISQMIRKKPFVDLRLNEISFGCWEGKTSQELLSKKDSAFLKWCAGKYMTPAGGETISSLKKRVLEFLNEKIKLHRGQKMAFVSHGGPIRLMIFNALKSFGSPWDFQIDPGSISVLSFFPGLAQAVSLNDTAHLVDARPFSNIVL